jgi:hypothetical protein
MNCSSNTATVTSLPPWSPAAASTTRHCNARFAADFGPRNVRDSRRVRPVTASGSDVTRRRHTPGDRSGMVLVRGFDIPHDDHESHPNRTDRARLKSPRTQAIRAGAGANRPENRTELHQERASAGAAERAGHHP